VVSTTPRPLYPRVSSDTHCTIHCLVLVISTTTHRVFPKVLMTDTVAVAETSEIHRISTQLRQRTHTAHLPVISGGPNCCSFHHVVECSVLWYLDHNATEGCHVRFDLQGVGYRYSYITDRTISWMRNTLRVRGGRNCQNDEAKKKYLHAGIYRRLLEFGEL
jgi:hypothetical protein